MILTHNQLLFEEINGKRYVMPEEKATKKAISITEHIDDLLIETLNIGKKQFFKEPIEDFELLNYYAKYGSFGFMIDLAINKYFVLDEKVAVRDPFYINIKERCPIQPPSPVVRQLTIFWWLAVNMRW